VVGETYHAFVFLVILLATLRCNIRGNLNNIFYLNKVKDSQSENEMIFALKGYWQDDHTFIEEFIPGLSSDLQLITQKYAFDGKKVTIEVNSSLDLFYVQATGEMVE
jgi:hypothetical protein